MLIPQEYPAWLRSLGFTGISFGYAGIKLLLPEEFEAGQTGHSISSDNQSLCNGEDGAWKPEWLVIGSDTLIGDPIILDTSSSTIMSAMHGEGVWEPFPIAAGLPAFAFALNAIKKASVGRENPSLLNQTPCPKLSVKNRAVHR